MNYCNLGYDEAEAYATLPPMPTGWKSRWDYWDWRGECDDMLRRICGLGVLRELRTKAGEVALEAQREEGEEAA
jgi:hypothetical protein